MQKSKEKELDKDMKIKCNNYFCHEGKVNGLVNGLGELEISDCRVCNGTGLLEVKDQDFLHPDANKIIEIFRTKPGFANWYKYLDEEVKTEIRLQISDILDSAALDYDNEI